MEKSTEPAPDQPFPTEQKPERYRTLNNGLDLSSSSDLPNLFSTSHSHSLPTGLLHLSANVRAISSPVAPDCATTLQPPAAPPQIPPTVRTRKFRAGSFAASLTSAQRLLLVQWLEDRENSLADIQRMVAAPAPGGFGMQVNHPTLRRLRASLQNQSLQMDLEAAVDAAYDLLHSGNACNIAPLRDSLIHILYSQAIEKSRSFFIPREMNHCFAAIERLERMKARAAQATRPHSDIPAARLSVDVKVHPPKPKKTKRINIRSSPPPTLRNPEAAAGNAH